MSQIKIFLFFACFFIFLVAVQASETENEGGVLTFVNNLKSKVLESEVAILITDFINNLEKTLIEAGPYGPLVIFLVYLVTTIFMLPLWGFHMTCGYVYGTWKSALLIASTQAICAGVAFSVSRHIVGPYVKSFLQKKYGKKYEAISKAVEKDGLRITLLLRLSPIIPFGMNNYVCGLTDMKLWHFVVGTFFGVLPGTTAYCNIGAMGKDIGSEMTVYQKITIVCGIVGALGAIKVISDLATKALKEAGIDDDTKKQE